MNKTDTKQLLFENMEKLNPDFKMNEVVPSDVVNMEKAAQKSPVMNRANSRIDTPQEFEQGFQVWFATTGFDPLKKPLSISQAQTMVRNAMMKLGYK